MASNNKQLINQPKHGTTNQLIGQFNHQLDPTNHLNQTNSQLNLQLNSVNQFNEKNQFLVNDNLLDKNAKKRTIKNLKKDAITKCSQQFNYQNLNVNLNPKERIVQDQSKTINKTQTELINNCTNLNTNQQLQFKIVQPSDEDGTSTSLKLKIATTRKSIGSNSELRKLRIPNQNNLTNVQTTINNLINTSFNRTNVQSKIQSIVQSNLHSIQTASINQNLINNHLNTSPSIQNLPSNLNKNLQITPNSLIANNKPIDKIVTSTATTTILKNKVTPVEAVETASGILNQLSKPQQQKIINNKSLNPDEHEENCMCWLHASKSKKHLNQLNSQLNKDISYKKQQQQQQQQYLNSNKLNENINNININKKTTAKLSCSSSSESNSSSASSSRSSSCSRSSSNSSSSGESSSSSDSSSYSSSNCSESNCSSSTSSSSNSRSVSGSRSSSCETCQQRSSSSSSSSEDEFVDNENKAASKLQKRNSRSKQKEIKHHSNQKTCSEQSKQINTQQLLNNVNESLIKHQKQKISLNQLNNTIASPFSPSDLPSPSPLNSNLNNNLNSISQPSSVSCESNCYSPSVSINSINSPSCQGTNKRNSQEERQRLRSYRLPNLPNLLKNKDGNRESKKEANNKDSDKLLDNNKKTLPSNRSDANLNNNNSSSTANLTDQQQTSSSCKKVKKQKLKGEKKKDKLKKVSLKKKKDGKKLKSESIKDDEQKKDDKSLKKKKDGQKAKKKGKKLKQQTVDQDAKEKKTKKKGKKKGKLKMNKKLISDAKLIDNLDLVKLLNPSNLNSSNSNSELSKMCLLMNANLNMGIPPNIDKNVILPGLSTLIKEDCSLLMKQNQLLLNKNLILNNNSNQQESNQKGNLVNNSSNKKSQSNASIINKSPDSGIQSQSESPNNQANNTLTNSKDTELNSNKKRSKKVQNSNLKSNKQQQLVNVTISNATTTSLVTLPPISTITSTSNDNLPKKNSSLLVNQISNISNLQKDPLFNQFMDSSLQSLLKNLQKTSANLSNLNQQPTTSSSSLINTSFNTIKPKSVPSDLITLTEILLNMNKNKETTVSNSTQKQFNNNLPTTSSSLNVPLIAANLPTTSSSQQINRQQTKKSNNKLNEIDLLKNLKKSNLNSFKQISTVNQPVADQQQPTKDHTNKIKNTDLWRNPSIGVANSPLMVEELNKRLRTSTAKLDVKKSNVKQKSTKSKTAKRSSKKDEQQLDYQSNVTAKEELINSLALNQHLKKNLLSDILCANEHEDTNSNQQLSSRSVSSLSQNYSNNKTKKRRKKHKSKKLKHDGFINELNNDSNKTYLNLTDDLTKLKIQMLKESTSKSNRNTGVFKCIKYSNAKSKKNSKSKQAIYQFNNGSVPLIINKSPSNHELITDNKTISKKRKKNPSISLDQQASKIETKKQLDQESVTSENANEQSLPLKKRHHRHTENKEIDDLIDSNSSSTDLSSIKISLRKTTTKSARKNLKSIDDLSSANQLIDSSSNVKSITAASTMSSRIEENVSQINSCAITWANSNHKTNDHSSIITENKQQQISVCPFNNTLSSNKRSINVDNKQSVNQLEQDQHQNLELNELQSELNMVKTRNNQSTARKLRSNLNNNKMGAVKSKSKLAAIVNSDELNSMKDKIDKIDKLDKNEKVTKNKVVDKKAKNKSSTNENSNQVQKNNTKLNENKQNDSSSINNLLKPKLLMKKRRKQNKTGFDKPKKRKKIIVKKVTDYQASNTNMNIDLAIDKLNSDDQNATAASNDVDMKATCDLNEDDKNDESIKNHDLNKKNIENSSEKLVLNKDALNGKKVEKALKSIKLKNKKKLSSLKSEATTKLTVNSKQSIKLKTSSKLKKTKLNSFKSKSFKSAKLIRLRSTATTSDTANNTKNSTNTTNSTTTKSAAPKLPLNKNVKSLKRELSIDNQLKPTKKIKLDKKDKNSKQQLSSSKHKQQNFSKSANTITTTIKQIEEETQASSHSNDDFEEIVLKIHSVYSTVLVKKPKQNKIKIKGPVKKYLKAGLFSDTFKEDPPSEPVSTTNTSASNTPVHQCETPLLEETAQSDNDELSLLKELDTTTNDDSNPIDSNDEVLELKEGKLRFEDKDAQYNKELVTDLDEFSTLLPPPCYVYNKERRKLNDFLLPYDIWWQSVNNQLSHNVNPAKNYKKIKSNVFFDVKPTSNFEEQSCVCVRPTNSNQLGCGSDCLNRCMWIECNPNLCPCGEQCSNQRLLKNEWAPNLERFLTRNRGWGVRTTESITKSSFIIEYIGEIVSEKVFKNRMTETYSGDSHHYCLNITSGIVIDGYRVANEGRFVNHSCEPNCEMQKWSVNGYYRVGLFALRDIESDEEVTYDYNFYNFNLEQQQICYCGSSKCRGVIGGKTKRENQIKQDTSTNLNSMEKLVIVKSILKKSDNKRKDNGCLSKVENSGTFDNSISTLDKKKLFELIKQFSYPTSKYIRKHDLFLIRNFERSRQLHNKNVEKKRRLKQSSSKQDEIYYSTNKNQNKDVFNLLYLTKDQSMRSVRTRGYAKVQDNEELIKIYKICNLFKEICDCFTVKVKDEQNEDKQLENVFNFIKELPRKKKNENLNQENAIDLATIERNIMSGLYKTEESFKNELAKLFKNTSKYYYEQQQNELAAGKVKHLEEVFFKILNDKLDEFSDDLNKTTGENACNENKDKLDDSFEMNKSNSNINHLSSTLRLSLGALTQTTKETLKILHDEQQLNQINLDHLDKQSNYNDQTITTNSPTTVECESQELQPLYFEEELPKFKQIEFDQNEEVIRCICTLNKDDGTMIQCDQCNAWAHGKFF